MGSASSDKDLDAMLGRFQLWSQKYRAKSAGENLEAGVKPGEGREVSYEEALRASSYRRTMDFASLDPLLQSKADGAEPPDGSCNLADLNHSDGVGAYPAPKEFPRTGSVSFAVGPQASFAGILQSAVDLPAEPKSFRDAPLATETIAAQRNAPQERLGPRPVARTEETRGQMGPPPITANVQKSVRTTPISASPATERPRECSPRPVAPVVVKKAASSRRKPRARPAFRDVVKNTAVLVAAANRGPAGLEKGKSTSLTLRVTDAEQAQIHARATQANLSVSAYLRQCAMGVEELRDQVERALAELHEKQSQQAPPPGIAAIPGILSRFAGQCLRRWRGSGPPTVVSLR